MRVKLVGTYSPTEKKYRIARFIKHGVENKLDHTDEMGNPICKEYETHKSLSVGLQKILWLIQKEYDGWYIVICGLQLHYKKGYGRMV